MIYAGMFPYDLYTFAEVIVNIIIGFYDLPYLNLFHMNANYRVLTSSKEKARSAVKAAVEAMDPTMRIHYIIQNYNNLTIIPNYNNLTSISFGGVTMKEGFVMRK
jgi:hypothetical protein